MHLYVRILLSGVLFALSGCYLFNSDDNCCSVGELAFFDGMLISCSDGDLLMKIEMNRDVSPVECCISIRHSQIGSPVSACMPLQSPREFVSGFDWDKKRIDCTFRHFWGINKGRGFPARMTLAVGYMLFEDEETLNNYLCAYRDSQTSGRLCVLRNDGVFCCVFFHPESPDDLGVTVYRLMIGDKPAPKRIIDAYKGDFYCSGNELL